MKTFRVGDILSDEDTAAVMALYDRAAPGTFAKLCCDKFIRPNITEINKKLGQTNDPMFLAYGVEYAMMIHRRNHP